MNASGVVRGATVAVGVLVLCAATYWVGTRTAQVVADSSRARPSAATAELWTAKEETVGRTLRLPATVRTVSKAGPLVQLSGVVTALASGKGRTVRAGDAVIEVAGRSAFAGRGAVPAYRALQEGDAGSDVAQLRSFLCAQGALKACGSSSRFDAGTAKAVAAWHHRHGLKGSSVELGEIMWLPQLPVRLAAAAKTGVGTQVAATDRPLDVLSGKVKVDVKLTRDQAALVPPGSRIRLGSLAGTSGAPAPVGDGTDAMLLPLLDANGSHALCRKAQPCLDLLDGAASLAMDVNVEVVPSASGVGVPTKAVQTGADGQTYVVTEDGRHVGITVVQSAGGMVLVDGLPAGTSVRLSDNG